MTESKSVREITWFISGRTLPIALVLLLLMLGLAIVRLAPPLPRAASAPRGEFSAARAGAILARLAGDAVPHPLGSPAQARTRQRLAAEIRRIGYAVREEQGFVCLDFGVCGSVRNLVAELPGRSSKAVVLLVAHYDSVDAGPGVSDDLAGVAAALEVARTLKAGPQPHNSIVFLLDEGEEAGLLGARGFLASSPESARVKAVVNLDARGTSGPSLMFETGLDNAWLVPLFAGSVPHPRTSSIFSKLYEYLPNSTDFSVFKRRGLSGFNFAFIGNPARYHTPLDSLANSAPASLQHHGENALATVRALANADLDRPHRGGAVFFDVLGLWAFGWPLSWGVLLAAVPLLMVIATAAWLLQRALVSRGEIARGFLAWWVIVLLTAAVGFALSFLLRLAGGLRAPWPAHGAPGQAAFWLLALGMVILAAGWFRRARFFGLWIGGWLAWALLGLVTALLFPEASYLFIVPAWVAGLAGLFLAGLNRAPTAAVVVPALAAGAVWFPLLILFYDGLGTGVLWLLGALLAIVLTALLPLGATAGGGGRRPLATAALVPAMGFAVAAAVLPAYSPDSPRRLNLTFHQDVGTGEARWLVVGPPQPLPPTVQHAASFGRPVHPFPWAAPAIRAYAAPAPAQTVPAPSLAVVRDEKIAGKRHLVVHLSSPRGASNAFIFVPTAARVETAAVAGERVPLRRDWPAHYRPFQVLGLPPGGVELDLVLGTTTPQEWYLLDRSAGLPPAGAPLLQARPAWASPSQDGDVTLVSRKVVL